MSHLNLKFLFSAEQVHLPKCPERNENNTVLTDSVVYPSATIASILIAFFSLVVVFVIAFRLNPRKILYVRSGLFIFLLFFLFVFLHFFFPPFFFFFFCFSSFFSLLFCSPLVLKPQNFFRFLIWFFLFLLFIFFRRKIGRGEDEQIWKNDFLSTIFWAFSFFMLACR